MRWVRVLRRTIARSTPSNEFYDVILELSPQKVAPSCSVQLGNVLTQVFDSGTSAGPVGSPAIATIPALADRPSVALAFAAFAQDATDVFRCLTIPAPWSEIDGFHPNVGGRHTNSTVDQLILPSGTAANWEADWTPCLGDASAVWRVLGFSLSTSATAPVQTANSVASSSTITLPNPPTPGNILVLFMVDENLSARGPGQLPAGLDWTLVSGVSMYADTGAVCAMAVGVYCVQEGDGQVISVGESYAHWDFVQEWALA